MHLLTYRCSPKSQSVIGNGAWNVDLLSELLPASIVNQILGIAIPYSSMTADTKVWPFDTSGHVIVKPAVYY